MKMELIIFASLYQAKEELIFYVHFYRRTFYLRGAVEVVLPFFHMKKDSAAKNSEVPTDALGRLCVAFLFQFLGCIW